ncbi:putative phosphoethanolamine transferase YbiP, partial [Haemophilus influenzae]
GFLIKAKLGNLIRWPLVLVKVQMKRFL